MSRSHALRNITIVGILLLLALAAIISRPGVSLHWRRAPHDPTPSMRRYRAPLVGCEFESVVEESFCVFLHHGCSLEKHKQVVGEQVNLDSKITNIFPETARHGLYYCASNIDDANLEAIRADIVVDMIECNLYAKMFYLDEDVELFDPPEL